MIDWDCVSALRDEVGPEDFDEVVDIFLQEVDEEIETLAQFSGQPGLGEKLHFLKGSAMNLGFREFSGLCQLGETALAEDPAARVDLDAVASSYHAARAVFVGELPTRFAG